MEEIILGFDVGGTKIQGALYKSYENRLTLLESKRIPTLREQGYESVLNRIVDLAKSLVNYKDTPHRIGFGMPGTINPINQQMINGNSQIFINQPFIEDFKKKCPWNNVYISIANDANCFALAEVKQGAGLLFEKDFQVPINKQMAIGIILGTGCGGGFIYNGDILNGVHGGFCEVGHHIIKQSGRECYCGRQGCAEQYLCGPSIEKEYKLRSGKSCSTLEIFTLSEQGNEYFARDIIIDYQNDLCDFLANLASLFDPHYFVLGGGVSKQKAIYHQLEEKLWKKVYLKGTKPKVYQHQISDSAGVIGAALKSFA